MDVKTFLNTLIPKFYKHLEQFEKKIFPHQNALKEYNFFLIKYTGYRSGRKKVYKVKIIQIIVQNVNCKLCK